jgi:antitoxin VapB
MNAPRQVKLFRNGRNQAVRIPREFELPGDEATIRREGEALIIEPAKKTSLLEWLKTLEPLADDDEIGPIERPPPRPFEL